MRWKIILVNAGILIVVALIAYGLLVVSLRDVLADEAGQRAVATRALRAANAQLALDAKRLELWASKQAATEPVRKVLLSSNADVRSERATEVANRLRDAATAEPSFDGLAPSLVLVVDQAGVGVGRNGSALMRGEKLGQHYPSLLTALGEARPASAVWLDRTRQEQMFVSYAPIFGDERNVLGLLVIGTPLNDDRLRRTSDLTSGQPLMLVETEGKGLELVAGGGEGIATVRSAVLTESVQRAVRASEERGGAVASAGAVVQGRLFGATLLRGYEGPGVALVTGVPAALVPSFMSVLWPVFGAALLGLLLTIVAGVQIGNYVSRPIAELEEGLLSVLNGNRDLRFELDHAELGGLTFRINSLLNSLMGVSEETVDDEGRTSNVPSGRDFREALSVGESQAPAAGSRGDEIRVEAGVAERLASEPAQQYYARLYQDYVAAKRQVGDPVDHITPEAFMSKIRKNEEELSAERGVPVRYSVEQKDGAVVLVAVSLPREPV